MSDRKRSFALSTSSLDDDKSIEKNLIDSFSAVRSGDVNAIQDILARENTVTITDTDNQGRTLLHIACSSSSKQELDVVRFLLEQGSGVNVQDRRNNTPLHNAARTAGQEVIKLLLTFGCDALIKNSDGQTPLGLAQAKARGQVIRVLRTHVTELTSVPRAPTCPKLVRATSSSLVVGWGVPESLGPAAPTLTTYDLRYSQRGLLQPWITQEGVVGNGPYEITGLKRGTDYVMSVRAVNRNGYGSWSSKSLTMTTSMDQSYNSPDGDGGNGGRVYSLSLGNGSLIRSPSSSNNTMQSTIVTPPTRSESVETLAAQRNAAEQRAVDLQRHRTDAESAMLRIEKERENVVKQLKKVQKITRELRSTLRKRDATIAEMKENERQRRQQQQMNHDDTNSDPTAAALKVASTILLRSESKEEENNECNRLKEKIVTLERKLLCSERRCQTAEALVVCTKKEVNTLREGRDKAEEVSKRAEERIIEVEKQIVEERKLRMNAEEISKDIESVIAKLQRQRDAAEALVKDLSGGGGGGGGGGGSGGNHNLALNSKTTLDTIKSLQDGLNESNKKLFLLAGIESKCKDLENENKSMEISIYESEEEIVRLENELAHIKKDRDGLREQRDIAEDVSEEVREERDRLSKKCKNLKLEIENIKMSNGAASGRSMSKNQLLREEEISKKEKTEWIEKSKLAKEREDKLQKAMSRAAEEVFNMMQSHREWLEKFEKVEQELGTYQIDTR